jgi:hypothetical protein
MLTNFNKPIISYYSPISAKGGRSRIRKTNKKTRNKKTRNIKTRNKKSGKYSRTKRNYH